MTNNILEVKDLHKSFGELQVLKGVTEHIEKGEVVSVIGPSGYHKYRKELQEPLLEYFYHKLHNMFYGIFQVLDPNHNF